MTHAENTNPTFDTFSNSSNWATRAGTPPSTAADWNMSTQNPCPAGYRVPTRAEFDGLANTTLNTWTRTGTGGFGTLIDPSISVNNLTNWTAGAKVGTALYLPAAGYRSNSDGSTTMRGGTGVYWTSMAYNTTSCIYFAVNVGGQSTTEIGFGSGRTHGRSVRCIAE